MSCHRAPKMENYDQYTKEQLISQMRSLKAHNTQLKNIIRNSQTHSSKHPRRPQKPFDFESCRFRHVLLKFLYLGWGYHGYVVQEDTANTIEEYIFSALIKTCLVENREKSNYHRCGRTDKGVSSFSQVISLDIRSRSDSVDGELNYCKLLNSILPDNIQFVAWCPVTSDFSARFDCKNRTYKYFFPKGDLDIEIMRRGAAFLEGSHDFRNFCKMDVNNGVVEFVRNILSIEINVSNGDGRSYDVCCLTVRGNAFLWHQIRYIISILILVGQRKEQPEVILELLDVERNPRKPDYHMASEVPLNLYDCHYDDVGWVYDKENVDVVRNKLYNFWTFSAVKTEMVKSMLCDLGARIEGERGLTSDCLVPGVKTRTYVPLMKRPMCDSLEERMQKCSKRAKQD